MNSTLVIGSHHALDIRDRSGEIVTMSWALEMLQSVEMVLVTQHRMVWFLHEEGSFYKLENIWHPGNYSENKYMHSTVIYTHVEI